MTNIQNRKKNHHKLQKNLPPFILHLTTTHNPIGKSNTAKQIFNLSATILLFWLAIQRIYTGCFVRKNTCLLPVNITYGYPYRKSQIRNFKIIGLLTLPKRWLLFFRHTPARRGLRLHLCMPKFLIWMQRTQLIHYLLNPLFNILYPNL